MYLNLSVSKMYGGNIPDFIVNTMPAEGLAILGAKPSVAIEMPVCVATM